MKFITDFPFLTAKRQRVEFFSCAYLYRVMEDNFHNIVDLSERYSGSQGYDFPLGERAKLFQAAWQVTESASGLYQIMNRSKELFKDFSSYAVLVPNLKISEALRNKRHIYITILTILRKQITTCHCMD